MRRITAPLLGALLLLPVFGTAFAGTPRDTIVVAKQIDQFISLDPAEAFEPGVGEVTQNLYDQLVGYRSATDPTIVGDLADSWSVADDGLTWRFALKPGFAFASGNPVTAQDAAWSLQRAVRLNKSPAFILTQFGFTADNAADRIRAVDDRTLEIRIDRAVAPTFFLNTLTATVASVVDAKLVQANEADGDLGNGWLKAHSAGSGPYAVQRWVPNERVVLEGNPHWRHTGPKTPHLVFLHVPEPASQRLLLEKGDVDYARDLTRDQILALKDAPGVALQTEPGDLLLYLGLNQGNPNLAKPEVREALKWLVDYRGIEDSLLSGTWTTRQSFLPTGYLGAVDDAPYRLDVDRAKALLARAGLADGFAVTIDVRNVAPFADIAQALQASFAKAGIRLEILPGDGKQTLTKYRARQHDITIGTWGPDYRDPHSNADAFAFDRDVDDADAPKTLAWRNRWFDAGWNQTVTEALREPDAAKRAALYGRLQREVQAEGPFVLLFQQTLVAAHRTAVDGLVLQPKASYAAVVKTE
ncbi:ABC transporter substrate-binding protein [Inquilinus sp. Marseille-Q2685]|uniref:ABC transporter substrate-binding protein n=1 Tax=Inquilinus sp. Marseille-Q2685 TaxID=2866581 RepID=UPI001CE47561|nr:ABC transporter substrate-binding protein [Inquilinus sp. Marseille-Q2685]